MKCIINLVKHYPFSCFFIAVIWFLCFMDVPETPLDDVTLIDKWAHILMYGGTCGTLWVEYFRRHKTVSPKRLFAWAWLAPWLMSGLIEVLQATCTGGRRSGDWLDFVANGVGVTLAAAIGILLAVCRARRKRG